MRAQPACAPRPGNHFRKKNAGRLARTDRVWHTVAAARREVLVFNRLPVRRILLAPAALLLAVGCGGGTAATPAPGPTPPPGPVQLVPNGTLRASGSKGVTYIFSLGSAVPAGETAVVAVLPPPPPCVVPACTAVSPPFSGIELTVAPQPLDVGVLKSVAFAGPPVTFQLAPELDDPTNAVAFTVFRPVNPAGGALVMGDQISRNPVLTLAANHTYTFVVFQTNFPAT